MKNKVKTSLLLLLTIALLLPFVGATVLAEEVSALNPNAPAIPASVGDAVNLGAYKLGNTNCGDVDWKGELSGATLSGKTFTPSEKGVYRLEGTADGTEHTLFIVVKNKGDDEYVLYENTFDNNDALTDVTTIAGSDPTIENGALKLTGTSSRVLLPDYLAFFGDYKIDAKVKMNQAAEGTRWMSVMYRVQNNNAPYYQMAVRQNATSANGVEFAENTPAGSWSVHNKASNNENLDPSKTYTFTIEAYGDTVQQSIDGEALIITKKATDYKKGRIGFQVSSCTMLVESIKVTLLFEEPKVPEAFSPVVNVRQFASNLATTPTIVTYVNTAAEYENILTDSPATALFYVNGAGEVTDKAGTKLAAISELYQKIGSKVIIGFIPENEDAVDKITTFLNTKKVEDVMIASTDKNLVKRARDAYKLLRGAIVIPSGNATDNAALMQIREDVNASKAKIAILPYEMAKKELVAYLQERLITVWVTAPENETEPQSMALILSGANGIVTAKRKQVEDCFVRFEKNSFTREIYIIGHRGVPSTSPENTVEGSVLATEYGAQIIENDIYITKDNVIVVMHDGTIDRTTDGTGAVEGYTYEQLQQFTIKDSTGRFGGIKIPTLEDYFKEFKGKETLLFVEIKSGKTELITELARLVKEYDFYDQMSVISFNANQLLELQKVMPGMSVGYLCGGITNSDPIESVRGALALTQSYNSTFNQSYGGMTMDFLTQANHRGITVWPWTYRERPLLNQYFLMGTYGLTTDYAQWTSKTVKKVVSEKYDYELKNGETLEIALDALQYNGNKTSVAEKLGKDAELVMLWGDDIVSVDGTTFTASGAGEAAFYVRYKTYTLQTDLVPHETIYVYSPVVRLTVGEAEISEPEKNNNTLTIVAIIAGVLAVAVGGGAVYTVAKKKKK